MTSRRARCVALADQLHSSAIHLLRQLRREDEASGISAPRLSALSVVVFGGPLTLGQLAQAEQVTPPTMTRIVSGLEQDGLIRRGADDRDGRLTRIRATQRGIKALQAARARRTRSLATAIAGLGASRLARLEHGTAVLQTVIAALRAIRPRPGNRLRNGRE